MDFRYEVGIEVSIELEENESKYTHREMTVRGVIGGIRYFSHPEYLFLIRWTDLPGYDGKSYPTTQEEIWIREERIIDP